MSDLFTRLQAALVGRYTLERELGRGGMATVYLAQDVKHHRRVAIKVLHPELAAALGAERFLREIEIAAQLTHPHILPLHDSGEAKSFVYYVMPYVEGESLRARLDREKQQPVEDALRIGREVAEALDYAHRHNVVHRDIKPENIMLEDGQAVVADFGIARAISAAGGDRLTETGISVGTPAYMSPEQAAADAEIDGRTDIYALGCVLYEMLGGQPPFTGPTAESVIHQHLTLEAPLITAMRPTVPTPVAQALARALAKTPADRFATAAQFGEALAAARTVMQPILRGRRWAPVRYPIAAAVGAVLAIGGIRAAMRLKAGPTKPISPNALAVLPFHVVGPALDFWREGMVDLFSINLDGAAALRAIPPRTVLSRWHRELGEAAESADQEAALRVARGAGARYALLGSMVGSGRGVRLSAEVYDLQNGTHPGPVQVEGSSDSIPALIDRLSLQLLRGTLLREAEALPTLDLSHVTTSSLPALKAYLEGEQKFRHARAREAIADFRHAIELDSTFALALYRLSAADGWTRSPHDPRTTPFDSAAARFADRLPRREALLLKGSAELNRGLATAIETLEDLTRRYPDDAEAWFQLGDAYYHVGYLKFHPPEKFRMALNRALEVDPSFAPAYLHLVEDAFGRQDSATVRRMVARLREIDPASPKATGLGLAYALAWGDSAARREASVTLDTAGAFALLTAKHATNFYPDFSAQTIRVARAIVSQQRHALDDRQSAQGGIGIAYLIRGRAKEQRAAWDTANLMRGVDPWKTSFHLWFHLMGYPDPGGAKRAATGVAGSLDPGVRFLLGVFAVTETRWSDAEREIRFLESAHPPADREEDSVHTACRLAAGKALRAYAAARRSDARGATDQLLLADEALSRLPIYGCVAADARELIRYELLRDLVEAGKPREAEPYVNGFGLFDWEVISPVEFYRGRIAEALGNVDEARVHYDRFVRWWQDCDPELRPWWEQGRQALIRLSRETK